MLRKGACITMSKSIEFHLLPAPGRFVRRAGVCSVDRTACLSIDDRALYEPMCIARERHLAGMEIVIGEQNRVLIDVRRGKRLGREAYRLQVAENGIRIEYGGAAGAFYAMMTLNQLLDVSPAELPCLEITDTPAFPTRGYMLDIGRGKVPKTAEILRLIDLLASVKINHLELYIEGVPFRYKSFPEMTRGLDLMTGEDVMEIDTYCRARFIEFVPTQNNFGHMDQWLRKEYRHLAECPDGFHFGGAFLPNPRCLNPLDPGSLELVTKLADDFLPYFTGGKYNVSCDETLELGQGKSKEACETNGKGRVYLDFLLKIYGICRRHGKQMLFWDDIIKHYPELLSELPKDVIALEWGYDPSQPTAEDCGKIQRSGVPFYVCPGTGAWNALLGRTAQMKQNISNAARKGIEFGAIGLLNTDWGDCGHLQSIATSYPGICYGAAMAWNPDRNEEIDLAGALDAHVYFDTAGRMGRFALAIGNAYLEEPLLHNITSSFRILISGLDAVQLAEGRTDEDFDRVPRYIDALLPELARTDLHCADAALIAPEYRLAARQIKSAALLGHYYLAVRRNAPADERAPLLRTIAREMEDIARETRVLWLKRNRYSYLDDSVSVFEHCRRRALEELSKLEEATRP